MQRNAYATNLAGLALRIVGSVHTDGYEHIRQALTAARSITPPRGVNSEDALIVTLAALVDPDRHLSELRALWTRPEPTPVDVLLTKPKHYWRNPIAVEMGISGALPACALNPAELARVVWVLAEEGMTRDHIARHLQTEPHHLTDAWPYTLRTAA